MQEELKEIEILTFIYKTLKEKADPRVSRYGTKTYRFDDSDMFEIFESEEGEEELWVGDRRIYDSTLKLIKEHLKEPESFYCRKDNTCENQCPLCTGGENK